MTTDTKQPVQPIRGPLTLDDVHKLIGALYMEIDMLRRENIALKQELENRSQ